MIYKRYNVYWVKLKINGREIRQSLRTRDYQTARSVAAVAEMARNKAVARETAHALIDSIFGNAEVYSLALEDSWSEYIKLVEASGKRISDYTLGRREQYWKMFLRHIAETTKIGTFSAVTRGDAVAFVAWLGKSDRKGKTRKNIISSVAHIWNMLAVAQNAPKIFDGLMPDTSDSEIREAFTREEEERILAQARTMFDGKWYLPSLVARYTGLRYSDVKSLEWSDFDEEWILRLTPNKTRAHGIRVTLPIVEPLRSALMHERELATSPYLFPAHALSKDNYYAKKYNTFADVLRAAGVETDHHTFHSWRHTFRTRLAENGVTDDVAKRLGGWTQDKTASGYDHAERLEELRAALEK